MDADERAGAKLRWTAAFRARLVIWARWTRNQHEHAARCGSIEGRYLRERDTFNDKDSEAWESRPGVTLDGADAQRMHRALDTTCGFPVKLYFALSAAFIFRLGRRPFCLYMRRHQFPIRQRELDELVQEAISAAYDYAARSARRSA